MREFPGFTKGINLGGWLSQTTLTKEHVDTFITEQDFKNIAAMGADHVRLPVDYPLVETEDGTTIPEGYTYIDNCVAWCEKYGLHMILDLHRTAGYVFDDFENCSSFFESETLQERFLSLWDKFAARYGKYDFIAFDLLNEIVDPNVNDIWNTLAAKAVTRIRKHAPNTWILIGGTCNNSINTVKDILPPPDEKIVYSFHFYEPLLFTHQGAYWIPFMPKNFRVKYPLTAKEYLQITEQELDHHCSELFRCMPPETSGTAMLESLFHEALAVADSRNVPLYCGEYGVINLAEPQSALAWHKDMHELLEKYSIGRAMWSYKEMDFGIIDEHYEEVFEELKQLL